MLTGIMIYLLIFFAGVIVGLKTAPMGYEDEKGFHFGKPGELEPGEVGIGESEIVALPVKMEKL